MSADINKTAEKLAAAALACQGWSWPDRMRDENGTHHFGQRRDGEFHEIGTIDASTYTGEYVDDIRVLKFLRAAQPEAILAVTAEIDGLRADLAAEKRKNLELSRVYGARGQQIERLDAALAAATAQPRPTDDHSWDQAIRDRDDYHEWADKLAEAIAVYFGGDIGEHSNANLPWAEALDLIPDQPAAQQVGAALDRPAGAGQELVGYAPTYLRDRLAAGDSAVMVTITAKPLPGHGVTLPIYATPQPSAQPAPAPQQRGGV